MVVRALIAGLVVAGAASLSVAPVRTANAAMAPRVTHAPISAMVLDDSLLGISGKLRTRFVPMAEAPALERALGAARAFAAETGERLSLAMLRVLPIVPFESKVRGRMGMYQMGYWPGERRLARSAAYDNPKGFIEVTRENQDLALSEHFRLRDFVTKDQFAVWPKYVVLREALIDKLELTMDELRRMGYPVTHLQVMSGFRHPSYNARGVGKRGRATESRHQYGDAADVFADNNRDGMMDDLDGDGRVTTRDGDLIARAVRRIELAHPELTGGMGRYHATHAHGPFVHIDVRGTPARWGGA